MGQSLTAVTATVAAMFRNLWTANLTMFSHLAKTMENEYEESL
jgi:hypothetical protein